MAGVQTSRFLFERIYLEELRRTKKMFRIVDALTEIQCSFVCLMVILRPSVSHKDYFEPNEVRGKNDIYGNLETTWIEMSWPVSRYFGYYYGRSDVKYRIPVMVIGFLTEIANWFRNEYKSFALPLPLIDLQTSDWGRGGAKCLALSR
jgi:hypothetical protein